MLAAVINHTLAGKVDVRISGAVSALSNTLARVLEQSDLEKRIEALEERISTGGAPRMRVVGEASR